MTQTSESTQDIVDRIAQKYTYQYDQVRNDKTRTDGWRRRQIAKIYLEEKAERDKALAQRDRLRDSHRLALERDLFGSGAFREDASTAISRRDAGDRAVQLKEEADALMLLRRADKTADEPLARAVLERAFEMRWADVANAFLKSRPNFEARVEELWDMRQPSIRDAFIDGIFTQVRPRELSALSDFQIQDLAKDSA